MIYKAEETDKRHCGVRKPTIAEALSALAVMIVIFLWGASLNMDIVPLMTAVASYSIFLTWRCGHSWREMEAVIKTSMARALSPLSVLLGIGMMIGAFIYCGTIPMLIYYGTKIISVKWLYCCAFLFCAFFSLLIGTPNGTVATIGIALMGLGLANPETNLGLLAGAILSGATIGDRISPMSGTVVYTASLTGISPYENIKHQLWTVLPAAASVLAIYIAIGFAANGAESTGSDTTVMLRDSFDKMYNWNIFLLVPVFIIAWCACTKKPTTLVLVFVYCLLSCTGDVL